MSVQRNAVYNLFGSAVPMVVSLVTIPAYLGLIGEARYGVLAIAWLLLGYFGLFDLGLGSATAQRIAAQRDASAGERAATFWTALVLNIALGVVGGLLIWPIATYFFESIFKVEDALRPEMRAAVPWLILAVPIATLSGVLTGALQGRERFLELNLISIIGTVLFQSVPLLAARFLGADLGITLPAALFSRLLSLVMLFAYCRRHVILGHAPRFVQAQAKLLLRFGGWITVTSLVGPLMVTLDRFIIGAVAGAKSVTFYTVPFQLGNCNTMIASSLSSALFPRFAVASPQEERRLAQEALRSLLVIMTPLIVACLLLIEPFLAWWINPNFAGQSAHVGRILLLGFWVNSLAIIPYAQLQARGRPDLVAKCHLLEAPAYFGLLYLGLSVAGMVGAAIAFSLRVLVDFALLGGLADIFRKSYRMLILPVLMLVTAYWIANLQTEWLLLDALALLGTLIWAWRQAPDAIRLVALSTVDRARKLLPGAK